MSNLVQELTQLQQEALAALAQTDSTAETEAWYADYLGRKGKMTAMLRGVGQLDAEERPLVGKRANEIKVALEAALQERQEAMAPTRWNRALAAEGIDVTLPGRRRWWASCIPPTRPCARSWRS
jgi:phenylalanyl-tRNA synthetase alpha chain